MKKNLLLACIFAFSLNASSQEIFQTKKLELKGSYTNPLMSPDGSKILLTNKSYNSVVIYDTKTKKSKQISSIDNSGYGYSWSEDGNTIFYKVKPENGYIMDSKVMSYNLKTKKSTFLAINHNLIPSYKGEKTSSNVVVFTNVKTGKIEAQDLVSQKKWIVTNDEGQFHSATLSHDQKKVALHNGSNLLIYNIDGSGQLQDLGYGLATSWSPDDKYIIGYFDESTDGHELDNIDLYLFDIAKGSSTKLTHTNASFESNPSFFGTNQIIYSDEKTGKIYTSQIKF
jgi:Tol biopolymer transport system component